MDIKGIVDSLQRDGTFLQLVNDPLQQLGNPMRPFLGPSLLPEENVVDNTYKEQNIQYRTVIANNGTRYSPVQFKKGVYSGSMNVSLGYSDIGSRFTARDYDTFLRLLQNVYGAGSRPGGGVAKPSMEAITRLTKWVERTLSQPLQVRNEKMRWDALIDASVVLTGDDGFTETVAYPNPTGQRVAAGGVWSNNSYDPWADIIAGMEFMKNKGYEVTRVITSTTVRSKLANNLLIRQRAGNLSVANGVITGIPGRMTNSRLTELLNDDGVPPLELYDLQYRLQSTTSGGLSQYFLKRTVMLLVAEGSRDQNIDLADLQPFLNHAPVGYTAIGIPANENTPGRALYVEAITNKKPGRISGQAWQASLPVITDPEAIYVITGIS